ncbi:MAG TPA: hypothetical protein EYQ25_09695 [Planctomycetes bacterium]|nr:hypothetical protein [Planctomycetota bacterium]
MTFQPLIIACTALALGIGSSYAQGVQPRMGDQVPGLNPIQRDLFEAGKVLFAQNLDPLDGLGPIMNDVSCGACHNIPAVGGWGTSAVTRFGKAAVGGNPFDPLAALGGTLLQSQTIDPPCAEFVPPEADVTALRLTPICFGAGLLEAIPEAAIQQNELNQPGLGLSGVRRMFAPIEGGAARASRFGWKGGPSTVLSFSIDASLMEMGLTSVFLPNEQAPNGDQALLATCDAVADPEDGPDVAGFTFIDRITHFQAMLAAPPQTPRNGMAGQAIFGAVGCADCHRPHYLTGPHAIGALSGRHIRPFSDFLIHDMGTGGDGIVDGPVSETQHMTRALWGLNMRTSLMHDGSASGGTFAQNIDMAIGMHDGEAAASRIAYLALSAADQTALAKFLRSLGQAEFDLADDDHDVDERPLPRHSPRA